MPIPCKEPRYRYKGDVRLAWCGNKVVEAKKMKRKVYLGNRGGRYIIVNGKKQYI